MGVETPLLRQPLYFPTRLQDVDDFVQVTELTRARYSGWERGSLEPRLHFTFLAQISRVEPYFRPVVVCHDSDGVEFKVAGYFDKHMDAFQEEVFSHVKPGRVLAIRYVNKKRFIDGSVGIRLEDESLPFIEVCPGPLAALRGAADRYFDALHLADVSACCKCGAAEADLAKKLKQCGQCRVAKYCSAACQQGHWPEHGTTCRFVPALRELTGSGVHPFDLHVYTGHVRFPPRPRANRLEL